MAPTNHGSRWYLRRGARRKYALIAALRVCLPRGPFFDQRYPATPAKSLFCYPRLISSATNGAQLGGEEGQDHGSESGTQKAHVRRRACGIDSLRCSLLIREPDSNLNHHSVTGSHLPSALDVRATSVNSSPPSGLMTMSGVVEVTPTGPLPAPATVEIGLSHAVPGNVAVVARTAESKAGPWSYLPAVLSSNRQVARVTTDHFSFFQILGINISAAVDDFKKDFLDQLDAEVTMDVSKPQCQEQSGARSGGYSITSSTTNTVYWCFGLDGQSRILKVTDDRRYPLEILHPDLTVSQDGTIDWGQLSSLSHFGSGQYTILAPGDTVTYTVDVPPQSTGGIRSTFDGLGQSLDALQVGITTLIEILTRFGLGGGIKSVDALGSVISDVGCARRARSRCRRNLVRLPQPRRTSQGLRNHPWLVGGPHPCCGWPCGLLPFRVQRPRRYHQRPRQLQVGYNQLFD